MSDVLKPKLVHKFVLVNALPVVHVVTNNVNICVYLVVQRVEVRFDSVHIWVVRVLVCIVTVVLCVPVLIMLSELVTEPV